MGFRIRIEKLYKYVAVFLILACVVTVVTITNKSLQEHSSVPNKIRAISDFTPYYFIPKLPHDFSIVDSSLTYSDGVLFFKIVNSERKQTLTIAEQQAPKEVIDHDYSNLGVVSGADGKAFIQHEGTQALGGLITTKRGEHQTLVIISTSDPVTSETLEDLLRSLSAVQKI